MTDKSFEGDDIDGRVVVDMKSPDQPADQQTVRRAAWAGLIGTALEQYDFVIYGTAAALVFNDIFFPDVSPAVGFIARSEEHTSELQSLMRISYAVFCLK